MKMKISPKNSKLGKIPNISLIPVNDCGRSDSCKSDCYALKAWKQYPAVRKAWRENSLETNANPMAVVGPVSEYLAKHKPRFFRIHVAGDFLNNDHVSAWCQIARDFQETKFLAFTKMHHLDYENIPENLSIIFSMFPLIAEVPQGKRIAWVDSDKAGNIETRIPADAIECPGICEDCGMCWDLEKVGKDIFFRNH